MQQSIHGWHMPGEIDPTDAESAVRGDTEDVRVRTGAEARSSTSAPRGR